MDRKAPTDMCPDGAFRQPAGLKRRLPWETILVVDDDPWMLALARDILAGEGYHVLEAPGGEDALRIAEGYAGPIYLLLTDVVMPGMNGQELAYRLRSIRSETKVLFMSAFTTELLADYGVISRDPLITKPFTLAGLAHKVREILDYRSPFAQLGGVGGRP
jgi:DNA-binding response OmpR family regulator